MTKSRFFWTVEEGKLVCYKRSGECNQCGDCCKAGIFYRMEVQFATRSHEKTETKIEDEDWTGREGWSIFKAQGIWWYLKIHLPEEKPDHSCGDLEEEKGPSGGTIKATCKSWQDETFRPICRYWPFLPEHLEWFPFCSFTFEEVEQ